MQSSSTFAAFVLLPKIVAWTGEDVTDDGAASVDTVPPVHPPHLTLTCRMRLIIASSACFIPAVILMCCGG